MITFVDVGLGGVGWGGLMTFVVDCKQTRSLLMTENKDNGVFCFF